MKIVGNNYLVYKKLVKTMVRFAMVLVFMSILFATFANKKTDGKRRRGIIGFIEEVRQLNDFQKYQALAVSGFLILTTGVALFVFQKGKQIIIELNFNDDSKVLTIKSQTLFSKQITEDQIPYDHLTLTHTDCFDLLAGNNFKSIQISNNKNSITGYILKGHFTWRDDDISLAEIKFNELVKNNESNSNNG